MGPGAGQARGGDRLDLAQLSLQTQRALGRPHAAHLYPLPSCPSPCVPFPLRAVVSQNPHVVELLAGERPLPRMEVPQSTPRVDHPLQVRRGDMEAGRGSQG